MKRFYLLGTMLFSLIAAYAQQTDYAAYPVYTGKDLGLTYTPLKSTFRIWAPSAGQVKLFLYKEGNGGTAVRAIDLQKGAHGVWSSTVAGNQSGMFYTFSALVDGKWLAEVPDPYAKAVGVNGKRAMVMDLRNTNPAGWSNDKAPSGKPVTDAIIYELHVRDASIAGSSGIKSKGKFIGLTERGTHNDAGFSTGLDHLKELGVTHIHLLPSFDFNSVDEAQPLKKQYNWGYDPLNYNTPEGSYATNATDGITRIREFKELIQKFHANGLKVVMDVVYNHTALTAASNFNQLVPGYYYRQTKDGKFSDATACGNEIASERAMVRKFMLESVKYWVQEYHVDGFRFDLMGVHDIVTMNLISRELNRIKPGILLYGEGWTAGSSPLPDSVRALKANVSKLEKIAVFSDDIRDGIKGSVFEHTDRGFASGKMEMTESIKFGIVAACKHPQVDYSKVNYSKAPYALAPGNVITYAECHDNHVLWDKLAISAPDASETTRREMQKLALSIVLTSQGIPFLHAGTEFLRSKQGVENSYNAGDSINAIDWNLKTKNKDVFDWVRGLIALRKMHPAFRMQTARAIADNLHFLESPAGVIAYSLNGKSCNDSWKNIRVYFNGTATEQSIAVDGHWKAAALNNVISNDHQPADQVILAPYSCSIIFQ